MDNKTTAPRKEYYQKRRKLIISFQAGSAEFKALLKEAAAADGRLLNGWLVQYATPLLTDLACAQLGRRPTNEASPRA